MLEKQEGNPATETGQQLGPVVNYFLHNLDAHIRYLDDGNTVFLFLTRAGVRIARCYENFLEGNGRRWPIAAKIMLSSRLLTCKSTAAIIPEAAFGVIAKEFNASSLGETLGCLVGDQALENDESLSMQCSTAALLDLYRTDGGVGHRFRDYLHTESNRFTRYLEQLTGTAKRVVLIDTGWEGTTQRLLARAFSQFEFTGLYFGWMGGRWDATIYGAARGMVFNSPQYECDRAETSITLHRHLIESLFEPEIPSIETLPPSDPTFSSCEALVRKMRRENLDAARDAHFCGVLAYLKQNPAVDFGVVLNAYQIAIKQLAKKLASPSRGDALTLAGPNRSADFGRKIHVPVLIQDTESSSYESRRHRLDSSLWPLGQIALEFEGEARRERQQLWLKKNSREGLTSRARENRERPTIAIITRTKDRPLLLRRAARSIANQSYHDFTWVVVNDGGDPDAVRDILRGSTVPAHQIIFCTNTFSTGMEAASNLGIRVSRSDLVIIHDDDDSWHPDFLSRTVEFLTGSAGRRYGGVITGSVYVSEAIEGNNVVELGRWPYHDWVEHIHLSELVVENFFPPIAFLFRREIAEEIGLFDEELAVLGDWDFALRFLMRADIGVIREQLAYYHHRNSDQASNYSNSVIGGIAKHIEFNAIVRNKFIRASGTRADWQVLGSIMAQAYGVRDLRARLQKSNQNMVGAETHESPHPMEARLAATEHRIAEAQRIADEKWVSRQANHAFFRGFTGFWRRLLGRSLSNKELRAYSETMPLAPPADFDESSYLKNYPDVASAVAGGLFASGYEHYFKHGRAEGRIRG